MWDQSRISKSMCQRNRNSCWSYREKESDKGTETTKRFKIMIRESKHLCMESKKSDLGIEITANEAETTAEGIIKKNKCLSNINNDSMMESKQMLKESKPSIKES